jgi:hypothetical protein
MDVSITEHTFSLRSTYDISAPGVDLAAKRAFFAIPSEIELTSRNDEVVATIYGHMSLMTHYTFEFADGRSYDFHTEKFWKGVYACSREGEETYTYYQHHGLRASIFQQDRQIAALRKNAFVIGDGNEYDICMNHDADVVVIACMVLAMNTADNDDKQDSTFNIDFGSIGPQDRAFDDAWVPT